MARVCLVQADGGEWLNRDAPPLSICNVAEPLGLLCLDAYLRSRGHDILLVHPGLAQTQQVWADVASKVLAFQPDVVGFSAMTNQIPATRRLALQIRSRCPNSTMVLGGDHISGLPDDLANLPEFDAAVSGEGEIAFDWLVTNFTRGRNLIDAPAGVHWREGNDVHGFGNAERVTALDRLPWPTRYPLLLKRSRVGALMWPPLAEQTGMASVYASRGCPYACAYCDARQVWGKGVFWRSAAAVAAELRWLCNEHHINTAFFVDLTFNSDRDKVFELCAAIERERLHISWYALLRPSSLGSDNAIDYQMLQAMRAAGCVKVGLGIETLDSDIGMDLCRVGGNGHVIQVLRWIDQLGMLSKVFLIIGHPSETSEYYCHLREHIRELQPDELRISFLTPFPGTPLWTDYRDKLDARIGYDGYTTFRPVMLHPSFSDRELRRIRRTLLADYYNSPIYDEHVSNKVAANGRLKVSFEDFHSYVAERLAAE